MRARSLGRRIDGHGQRPDVEGDPSGPDSYGHGEGPVAQLVRSADGAREELEPRFSSAVAKRLYAP